MRHTPAVSDRSDAFVIPVRTVRRLIALVVVALLLAAGAVFASQQQSRLLGSAAAAQIDRNAYQVVFLTTGQAFYGRLTIADADTYLLADAFYLTNDDSGQPTRLVRRGAEVFGPREPMVIQARQVLWFENLRDDSDLVKGIRAIKSGQVTPPVVTAAPPVAPTATARPSATR